MQKILIVDDEKKIVNIVEAYLEKSGFKVYKAFNGIEALEQFKKHQIDLVVLDLMLPDLSGEEVCKTVRKNSSVPIIMLTAKVKESNVLEGFSLGADDYVMKPFSPRQLLARIEAILRRVSKDEDESSTNLGLNINEETYEVKLDNQLIDLTLTEFKILNLFASHPNKVYTREEIIELVFGYDYDGYDRTLDSHIKNIRKKLGGKSNKYIKTVYGVGYKLGDINVS